MLRHMQSSSDVFLGDDRIGHANNQELGPAHPVRAAPDHEHIALHSSWVLDSCHLGVVHAREDN